MAQFPTYTCRNTYGVYYFRIAIPHNLRPWFGGRAEYKQSLRTKDSILAKLIANAFSIRFRYVFEALQAKHMKNRIYGFEIEGLKASDGSIEIEKLKVDPNHATAEMAAVDRLLDKVQQVLTASGQTAENSPQGVSQDAVPASSPGAQTTLSGLVDQYCKFKVRKKKWSKKTADENRPILATLPFVVGDIPLSNVNHNIIEFYAQTLEKLPASFTKKDTYKNAPDLNTLLVLAQNETSLLNVSTQAKYLNRISTMFKYAIQCQLMTINPAEGMAPVDDVDEQDKRDPYEMEELNAIFSAAQYKQGGFDDSYQYWLPLLGLFTGARIEELCKLQVEDIYEEEGVHVIEITRKVKTKSSKRKTPLHDTLLGLDFLEFVEHRRRQGVEQIFPELKADQYGDVSNRASNWYRNPFCQSLGVWVKGKKVFHSFRHTLGDCLKQKEIDEKLIGSIFGHKDGSVTTGLYGGKYKPSVLKKVVDKLDYERSGLTIDVLPWQAAIKEFNSEAD